MPKGPAPLGARARRYAQMKANDMSRPEILLELFGLDVKTADPAKVNAADQQCLRWRNHPQYFDVFDAEIERILRAASSKAVKVLKEQMDPNAKGDLWLQNKAANDIIQHRKTMIAEKQDSAVTIKIEGMPELGSPEN